MSGIRQGPMGAHGGPMGAHGGPWGPMGPMGGPWAPMGPMATPPPPAAAPSWQFLLVLGKLLGQKSDFFSDPKSQYREYAKSGVSGGSE